jgi:hypothetical protein
MVEYLKDAKLAIMPPTPATNSKLCRRIGEPGGRGRLSQRVLWRAEPAKQSCEAAQAANACSAWTPGACARAECIVRARATAQGAAGFSPSDPPTRNQTSTRGFGRTPNKAPHSADSRRTEYAPHVLRAKVGDHCTRRGVFVDHRILWRLSREGAERVRSAHRAAPASSPAVLQGRRPVQ